MWTDQPKIEEDQVKQDISQTGQGGLQNIKPCTTETERNQSSTTNQVEIKEVCDKNDLKQTDKS